MYRLAEAAATTTTTATGAAATTSTTTTIPELRRRHTVGNSGTATAAAALEKNCNVKAKGDVSAHSNHVSSNPIPTPSAHSTPNLDSHLHSNVNEDAVLAGLMDTSTFMPTWPWLAPTNSNEMQIDWNEHDLHQWTSNPQPFNSLQSDASAAFLDSFPGMLGWTSSGINEGDNNVPNGPQSSTYHHEHRHSLSSDVFDNNNIPVLDKNSSGDGIARLSQLSTRLYPLYHTSCALAEAAGSASQSRHRNQARQRPLIDDAAFKSMATWLVHVSSDQNLSFRTDSRKSGLETASLGDALHDAFSASHHLLEILQSLQADAAITPLASASNSAATSAGSSNLDFWSSITPQSAPSISTSHESVSYFDLAKGPGYMRPSNQASNTVVRHLVSACHTLLLNVYVAVLVALQHETEQRVSSLSAGSFDDNSCGDSAALADIRLVMVVQLCSYLTERQRQAVDLYVSPLSSPPSSQHDIFGSGQPSPPASTAANREVTNDLEMEVAQRLARLRQTLRL